MVAKGLTRDYSKLPSTRLYKDWTDAFFDITGKDITERNSQQLECPVHKGRSLWVTLKGDGRMRVYCQGGCGADEANNAFIKRAADEHGIDPRTWRKPSRHHGEDKTFVPFTEAEWERLPLANGQVKRIAAKKPGVPVDVLDDMEMRLQGERIVYAAWDDEGRIITHRYWSGEHKSFISAPGSGSGAHLVIPWGLSRNEPVWLCESETTAWALAGTDRQVAWIPGASMKPPAEEMARLDGYDVVVSYDAGEPGRRGADWVRAALVGVAASVRVVQWPDGTPDNWDLRDELLGCEEEGVVFEPEELLGTQSMFDRDVELRLEKLRVDAEAKRKLKAEQRSKKPVPVVSFGDEFELTADEETEWLIEGLWAADGNVVFSAQAKAGKTTTMLNAVRALCDGRDFFDCAVAELTGRVFIIDTELGDRRLRRWLRKAGIRNKNKYAALSLKGNAAAFDIMDPEIRAWWVAQLRAANAQVVILDALRPVMMALGLDEHNGAGPLLNAMDELLAEAGVAASLIVHHAGHNNERSMGDSRIRQWPDAEWVMTRNEGTDERSFRAYGRDDIDVDKFFVEFDEDAWEVVRGNDVPPPQKRGAEGSKETSESKVRAMFVNDDARWFKEAEVVEETGLSQSVVNDKLKRLVAEGLVRKVGERRHFRYGYHANTAPLPDDVTRPGKTPVKGRGKARNRR